MSLNKYQIKKLPKFLQDGVRPKELAERFGCHRNTIGYWIRKYRKEGVTLKVKKGPNYKYKI